MIDDDDYQPDPNNAQVLTYDRWLARQMKQYPTPQKLAKSLFTDSAPEEFKQFKQTFLLDQLAHPQRGWDKDKELAPMKGETLVMRCQFLKMLDDGISQTNAISKLAELYDKDEATIRERVKRKK